MLREARLKARRLQREYITCIKESRPPDIIASSKSAWNASVRRCKSLSRQARARFCLDWRQMLISMKSTSPRNLWSTFRRFTNAPTRTSTCAADEQWNHWASQGDISESVWRHQVASEAAGWCDELRRMPLNEFPVGDVYPEEVDRAKKRVRPGKSAGIDGLPSDAILYLPCLSIIMPL